MKHFRGDFLIAFVCSLVFLLGSNALAVQSGSDSGRSGSTTVGGSFGATWSYDEPLLGRHGTHRESCGEISTRLARRSDHVIGACDESDGDDSNWSTAVTLAIGLDIFLGRVAVSEGDFDVEARAGLNTGYSRSQGLWFINGRLTFTPVVGGQPFAFNYRYEQQYFIGPVPVYLAVRVRGSVGVSIEIMLAKGPGPRRYIPGLRYREASAFSIGAWVSGDIHAAAGVGIAYVAGAELRVGVRATIDIANVAWWKTVDGFRGYDSITAGRILRVVAGEVVLYGGIYIATFLGDIKLFSIEVPIVEFALLDRRIEICRDRRVSY